MSLDDQDLQERFAALRREDASRAPGFEALQRRRPPAVRPWRARAVAAAALLVVATLLFKVYQRPASRPGPLITEWRSPTDFLLQTPGRELLQGVPTLARAPYGTESPQATPTPLVKRRI
jgi:hypothetical protein